MTKHAGPLKSEPLLPFFELGLLSPRKNFGIRRDNLPPLDIITGVTFVTLLLKFQHCVETETINENLQGKIIISRLTYY